MPERRLLRIGPLRIVVGSIPSNSHGPKRTTLRSTWLAVNMTVNPGIAWGWRWYRYRADGSCYHLDVLWRRRQIGSEARS